ncbi:MAG: TetR/AcrR family transcriptional regulator [Deltaproteobacteria bacterium]|nr:TetR/AcrR family transcriptional regulator [Deltaproteobacteria bacterium]
MKSRIKKTVQKSGQGRKSPQQRMSGQERSDQIARVAADLFSRKGFNGTTTREIARKAGISEAVIFKHFSSKEDLYKAIIDSCCSDKTGESRLLSLLPGKEGREVFMTIAVFLLDEHQKDPSLLRLLTYSALEQQSFSELFIKTRGLDLLEFLERHIRELEAKGEIRAVDPVLAARAFMGMTVHYSIAQELYGFKRYFTRPNELVAKTFVDIFFEGLKRR